ncbi:MAG TPA: TetR/AcrR family transcriptional regulator [Rhabdaerophilum sp.]|nr:TetR/AcrR family transcriptional regulator [Rhabdaerophilum sp.]
MAIAVAVKDEKPEHASENGSESAKRRQVLDGARQVFMRDGFDGASMNDVARIAGVSKGTLYVYFPSKEALFEAYVRDEKRRQAEQICRFDYANPDVAVALESYARNFIEALTRPEALAHTRTVIGVTAKIPSIGRAFFEAGPSYGIARFADYIQGLQQAGKLEVDDPEEAAVVFLELAKSGLFGKLIFCADIRITREEIEAQARRAVRLFLRLYGRQQPGKA